MNFLHLDEVDSTNKYAKEHLKDLADKTVVYTYKQTEGRGRLERKWNYTGADNIYASIVLKPGVKYKQIFSNLTQLLCLVITYVMEEYNVRPKIKWPNDVKINGKKIAGILAEGSLNSKGKLEGLVIGFGINLNTEQSILNNINQPATSLNIEAGIFIDKEIFLKTIIEKFCLLYNRFIEEGFSLIENDYKMRAEFLNKQVSVKIFDKIYSGLAVDVTKDGALKIVDSENKEHILYMGDIL